MKVWDLRGAAGAPPWDEVDCEDSGAVTHAAWSPRPAAPPLLLTAHCALPHHASRVLARDATAMRASSLCVTRALMRMPRARACVASLRSVFLQVWDFQAVERTRPLQQYTRAFPARAAFAGRVHALQAAAAAADEGEAPLALFATGDGLVTVFAPASGQVQFTLRGEHAPRGARGAGIGAPVSATVTAARLSPCGRLLATAGVDNAIKACNARAACDDNAHARASEDPLHPL